MIWYCKLKLLIRPKDIDLSDKGMVTYLILLETLNCKTNLVQQLTTPPCISPIFHIINWATTLINLCNPMFQTINRDCGMFVEVANVKKFQTF